MLADIEGLNPVVTPFVGGLERTVGREVVEVEWAKYEVKFADFQRS